MTETVADVAEAPVAPVVAVVGRPNVGKSTLVNRILGRREAVVQDVPGVTRDRVAYDALWNGRRFTLVDTGGWEPDARGLQAMVSAQAERAAATADVILFVVDGRTGATETDLVVARTLRRAKRPVVLAVTKVDDDRLESDTAELWSLGWGSRTRSAACTGAAAATCSTPSWPSYRTPRPTRTSKAGPDASRWSAGRTSGSPAC